MFILYLNVFPEQVQEALLKSQRIPFHPSIAVIVFLALLVQLPLVLKVKIVEYDEAIFLDVASNIQRSGLPLRSIGSTGVFFFDHTLLYPYFLSTYAKEGVSFSRWVTTLFSLGCVLLVYNVGKRSGGHIAGFVSALVLGIQSFFALYSHFVRMEIFCLFFLLVGLSLIRGASTRTWLAGVALAIAVLFKEIALLFTAICGVYVLINLWRDRPSLWRTVLLVVAPSIAALVVWGIGCWLLSPSTFIAVMQRWIGAASGAGSNDPRVLAPFQWVHRIVVDLLGPGLTALWALAVIYSILRKRLVALDWILLGYPVLAILLSFFIRLKEPRHLIGVLPTMALFIGTKIDWNDLLGWARENRLHKVVLALVALAFLFSVSPLRLPLENARDLNAWFDPLYAWRLFENDRYYNVLRLAGLYLQEHTDPDEVITVVHEATVTAYYASRHYYMLYTIPLDRVLAILEQTRYLVWDHELFLALNEEEIQIVREYVKQHFFVEQVIRDQYREVTIHRRRDL
jgi:4-amino-4-deoxy-L-arabinose transferase-like glycosyltransferase